MPTLTQDIAISKDFTELIWSEIKGLSTYTIDTTTETVLIKSSETDKPGYGKISVPNIKAGAIIEVTCEAKQGSGSQGRIALDFYEEVTNNKTSSYIQPDNAELSPVSFVQIVPKGMKEAVLTFGFSTALTGEISFKNIRIRIYNGSTKANASNVLPYVKTSKAFVITSSATGVFVVNGTFSFDEGTVTVDTASQELILTFARPFTFNKRPSVIVSTDAASLNREARSKSPQLDTVRLVVIDPSTRAKVDPATIPAGLFFTVHVAGFDAL